jgi:methionyl-tRNA formyltransferase
MRLIFMGTPAFAVPTLEALIASPHEVVAVYTQPPRPAGRGQKLTPSPVHQLAERHGIPVLTPTSLKSAETQKAFRAHRADAAIVAAYGLLLPRPILEACPYGCINIHPSDLPRWRGAAPLQRTIMAGDTHSALCIMQMDDGLDTGDVLLRAPFTIPDGMTAGALHDYAATASPPLLLQALEAVAAGKARPVKQATEGVTYAAKISKEEAAIDWTRPATEVRQHILGLSPFPGATFDLAGERWKALSAELAEGNGAAGVALDDALTIACGESAVRLLTVQRPGKAAMSAAEALRGHLVPAGTRLG